MNARAICLVLTCSFAASMASAEAKPAERACEDEVTLSLEEAVEEALLKRAADATRTETPLAAPSARETGPPSTSSQADSPVDKAEIPWLAALGIGSDLVSRENGVLTVQVNPFGFMQALNPAYQRDDRLYQEKSAWRRFGGTLSLGGKGEEFDRDGDGNKDPALEAKDLQDVVNWEVQYQILGSRDRREGIAKFFQDSPPDASRIVRQFGDALDVEAAAYMRLGLNAADTTCFERQEILAYLLAAENEVALDGFQAATDQRSILAATMEDHYKRIDRALIMTLAVGGVSRRDGFGRDELKAALRVSGSRPTGTNPGTHNFNLDWVRIEALDGTDEDPEKVKAGYEYSRLVLRGTAFSKDGATLSASGAYEQFRHVPDADHDTNAILNAKIDFPISEAVSIPLSVTWSNHADLITQEDSIRGHFGFSVDLSKLKDQFGR